MPTIDFRHAQGAADAPALLHIHHQCAAVDGHDPVSLLAYQPDRHWYADELGRGAAADWTIAEVRGEVVGYGHTLWDWPERDGTHVLLHLGWVAPAWRNQGIGTALVSRLEARCVEKAANLRAARYEFGANAAASERDACAHLQAQGYAPGYHLWEMEWDSAWSLTAAPLPAGYELRPVIPEHHRAIWQCIGDAYAVSRPGGRYASVPSEADFTAYFAADSADPTLYLVAWEGSRVAGQVLCRVRAQGGEIFEVSVGYGHRRRGLARALLTAGLAALQARGVPRIRLYTVYENPTRAWQLYAAVGFQQVAVFPRWRKPVLG